MANKVSRTSSVLVVPIHLLLVRLAMLATPYHLCVGYEEDGFPGVSIGSPRVSSTYSIFTSTIATAETIASDA